MSGALPTDPSTGGERSAATPKPGGRDAELHDLLFGDSAPAGPSSSPAAVAERDRRPQAGPPNILPTGPVDLTAAWPGNIPAGSNGLAWLRDASLAPAELQSITATVAKSLGRVELAALTDEAGERAALRMGIAARWRLQVALSLLPSAGGRFDPKAMDGILAEVDVALRDLVLPEDALPELKEAHASTRAALARDAVAMAERAASVAKDAARSTVAAQAQKKYAHVAKVVALRAGSSAPGKQNKRARAILAVFMLSVLGGGGFHAWRLTAGAGADLDQPEDFRVVGAGTILTDDTATGAVVLHAVDGANRAPADEVKRFTSEAERMGGSVMKVGAGSYIVVPGPGRGSGAAGKDDRGH